MEQKDKQADRRIRVLHVCNDEKQQAVMSEVVAAGGFRYVGPIRFEDLTLDAMREAKVQACLVSMGPDIDQYLDVLDAIVDAKLAPVIFEETEVSRQLAGWEQARWARHILAKIQGVLDVLPPRPDSNDAVAQPRSQEVRQLWVLCASIGGPEAVRAFLGALPADIPSAFILAQHMGAEFLPMMTKQLDKASQLKVIAAEEGSQLCHGQVLVAPVDKRILVNETNKISLESYTEPRQYSPDINQILHDMAKHYGQRANAIIFSGMASDAVTGAQEIHEHGGQVWAQSEESCIVASMVEGVRKAGIIGKQNDPAGLAKSFAELYAQS